MSLNFEFLFWFLMAVVTLLWVSYLAARIVLGPQAAGRNLFYAAPWLLVGAAIALFLSFIGRYGLTILYGLYAVAVFSWLLSWPIRKKQTGELKLEVGRTSQNKWLLWIGLGFSGLAIAMTLPVLERLMSPLLTTGGIVAGIVEIAFWWAIALLFIFLGLSDLEIRENGLSYLYAWQPWDRVEAFGWDDEKPNTLLLRVVKRTPFSRRYVTMGIPPEQKEAVDQLIDDYISEADLAAEMDAKISL